MPAITPSAIVNTPFPYVQPDIFRPASPTYRQELAYDFRRCRVKVRAAPSFSAIGHSEEKSDGTPRAVPRQAVRASPASLTSRHICIYEQRSRSNAADVASSIGHRHGATHYTPSLLPSYIHAADAYHMSFRARRFTRRRL